MHDIVELLCRISDPPYCAAIAREAAAEINQLRDEVDRLRSNIKEWVMAEERRARALNIQQQPTGKRE